VQIDSSASSGDPHIALNRAELSFKTTDENWMRLDLKFTNLDQLPISMARSIYIAFDDDAGRNFIRRPLPHVNLHGLAPGQSADFQERLLIAALRPGHYQIKLWIPSSDPKLRFDAAHNFLISSMGVGDEKSGLNKIAEFSVTR
jgi:hypothetical protein